MPETAPALWNERGETDPEPIGTPARFADASDERIAAAIDQLTSTVQQGLVRDLGADVLRRAIAADGLELPPAAHREGYFGDDDLAYWLSGYGDGLLLRQHTALGTLLDFGCSSGRVLRHLHSAGQVYGVDINVNAVRWARDHLPFPVAQGTIIPALPFPDATFDTVYAGSVLTHIDEMEESWLLELRRVLKPGGRAVVTFHPDRLWQEMTDPGHHLRTIVDANPTRMDPGGPDPVFDGRAPAERVVFTITTLSVYNVNVVHSQRYVREHWGRLFKVVDIVPRAHGEWQDAAILEKAASHPDLPASTPDWPRRR